MDITFTVMVGESAITNYTDEGLEESTVYCYEIIAYNEFALSDPSPEVCTATSLPGPTSLIAVASEGTIDLNWTAAASDDVLEYLIYRDDEFIGSATGTSYNDNTAINDILYCYTVSALYDLGESETSNQSCTMWMILPPTNLTAEPGNSSVHLEWMEPSTNLCADEIISSLPFFAEGSNVGMSNDWDVQASDGADVAYSLYLSATTTIDLHTCWEGADYDTKLEIFTADMDCIPTSTGFYDDDNACTLTNELVSGIYGVTLEAGQYYIVVDGYGGQEGNFGLTVEESTLAAMPPADIYESIALESEKLGIPLTIEDWDIADGSANRNDRPLTGYNIYQDDQYIANVGPEVYEYNVTGLDNLAEYCFHVAAQFDEGESPESNIACAIPIPGEPPTNLTAVAQMGLIHLDWTAPLGNVIEYIIYRDTDVYDSSPTTSYDDSGTEPGQTYCYRVTALYDDGESQFSNQACAAWILPAVAAWIDYYGCGSVEVAWNFDGGGLCNDELIPTLPFTGINTNVGMVDDFDVQGSDGDDFAYSIYLPETTTINVTVCLPATNFDTKLEIFYADDDCNETTTGYYNDNVACEYNGLYSIIENAVLEAGEYYIVVDGYDGDTGNFGIFIEELTMELGATEDLPDELFEDRIQRSIPFNIAQGSAKTGAVITMEDWTYAFNENRETRDLIGFAIERFANGGEFELLTIVGPDVFSYVDTEVQNGTEYCYIVTAQYEEGDALPSNMACTLQGPPPPTPPTDFDLTIIDCTPYATLTWSALDGSGQDGFNIYRDGELLANVGADVFSYDDYIPEFYMDHCWFVTTTIDCYESNPTETLCGSVNDPADYSVLSIDGGTVVSGESITVNISLANVDPVSGFQFYLANVPDLLTMTELTATPRLIGYSVQYNELPDGSIIVVGFDMNTAIAIGEGPILEATFQADTVLVNTPITMEYSDVYLVDIIGDELLQISEGNTITVFPTAPVELIVDDGGALLGEIDEFNISMNNTVGITAFQFTVNIDPPITQISNFNPTDRLEGWVLSFDSNTVIGISPGIPMEPGEGPILAVEVFGIESGIAEVCVSEIYMSIENGDQFTISDQCGEFTVVDDSVCPQEPVFYTVEIPPTGESSLVVITDIVSNWIEIGSCSEVGVFDMNAITNSGDCETELGEQLVGSGIWDGEQLEISAIGSLDYCAYGGFQYPGYVEGNPIVFKLWNEEDGFEYCVVPTYSMGEGNWGDLVTAVTLEVVCCGPVPQCVTLHPFMNNMFSFNIVPVDLSTVNIFGDDIFIAWNDGGEYYVPAFGIDQIGMLDILDGYKGFKMGPGTVDICVEGMATDDAQAITWNPFMNNVFAFLPQEEMAADYAFEPYDDYILIISNDAGSYYIPSLGVNSLLMLHPGEAYQVFIFGTDTIDFYYPEPMAGLSHVDIAAKDEYYRSCQSEHYELVPTGISHPVIITELVGAVEIGDELAAYADGQVVGAAKIVDLSQPIVISAWGGYDNYGLELPGYTVGDAIELRLWSSSQGTELKVMADLDSYHYGETPLTSGTIAVTAALAIPTDFTLSQNFPNPFNLVTTIEFSVPEAANLTLNIYDIQGRLVKTLVQGVRESGYQSVIWDGMDFSGHPVSAGMYIYTLQSDEFSLTRKMLLMK